MRMTREPIPKAPGISPELDDPANHEASMRASSTEESPWRDIIAVIGITILGVIVAFYFNLNEKLYAVTRGGESFQLDEWPIGMFVLLIGLVWLSARRYRHAFRELRARRIAEVRLDQALAENRQLAQENLRIQETERKYLARELHDEFGQYLNAIKLDAVAVRESGGQDTELARGAALSIIRTVDHVHRAVSDMIGRLRPVGLDELGLVAAVEHCIDSWRQRVPAANFSLSVRGQFEGLSESLNLTIYRLIQESLTNIHKHANAQRAEIVLERLDVSDREVQVTVVDDGCGMESSNRRSRFGLSGMRERVEMAGGTFALDSAPGRGLRITALLPTDGGE
jgi:two-component system sensor histidine kinase UhpB